MTDKNKRAFAGPYNAVIDRRGAIIDEYSKKADALLTDELYKKLLDDLMKPTVYPSDLMVKGGFFSIAEDPLKMDGVTELPYTYPEYDDEDDDYDDDYDYDDD